MGNKHKRLSSDSLFEFFNAVILIAAFLIVVYPLVYVFSSSFSSARAVMAGRVRLLPIEPTLAGYRAVFSDPMILSGYANTLFYTVVGTSLNIAMTIMAAYPLSRKDFKAGGFIMVAFTFTMFFSGGMIPTYLLINKLGWINHRIVMIVPVALSVYNVIIARAFFKANVPDELHDAAKIDGCSDFRFLGSVVLPISKSIIAVLLLFYAVNHWNSFFTGFLYLSDRKLYPLQLVLRQILLANDSSAAMNLDAAAVREGLNELLKYALIVVASVPVLCLYPFIQKYFVKGVLIGSIKG
jgi:putative aldouronate transport system permease protein